jgi:hypothetical protein
MGRRIDQPDEISQKPPGFLHKTFKHAAAGACSTLTTGGGTVPAPGLEPEGEITCLS